MLRVISGRFKSRKLETPEGAEKTRPLPDRVRVSLFNMLNGHFEGQTFFDVFAGSGSFGLEALSRGADRCVFIERDREVAAVLRRNIASLGAADRCEVFLGDALGPAALSRCPRPVHVILFDPPYPMMEDPSQRRRVFDQFSRCIELLDEKGFALIRTPWPFIDRVENADGTVSRVDVPLTVAGAIGPETHHYGHTAIHWYMRASGR